MTTGDFFSSPLSNEVRYLANQLFDRKIGDDEIERLESLLLEDQGVVQVYVEQLDFHCQILQQAGHVASNSNTESGQPSSLRSRTARKAWKKLGRYIVATGLALSLLVGTLWVVVSVLPVAPGAGSVINLSAQVESQPALELGQFIHCGQRLRIAQGVMSLQLPGVIVDVIGPAELQINDRHRLSLRKGTVVVKVGETGKGFTVTTPDGEVVDYGTNFLVQYDIKKGTCVSVRSGRVEAKLLDWRGRTVQVVELTESRAAVINFSEKEVRETDYLKDGFEAADQSRGDICRISGDLRTLDMVPPSLQSNVVTTPNHILVIPEQQSVLLKEDLIVDDLSGPIVISKGTTISSYLVHCDPTSNVSYAPRGAITFSGRVAAVIGTIPGIVTTDMIYGLPKMKFESRDFRGIELDEDEIEISGDRRTVSFHFGVSPPEYLDQVRVLVMADSP